MRRFSLALGALLTFALGLSLDVRFGDLRYALGGKTLRHWTIVDAVRVACADFGDTGGSSCSGFVSGGGGAATSYTLSGPTSGTIGVTTGNYTVQANGTTGVTVTPSDTSHGGIFNPTSMVLSNTTASTFTYVPLQIGTYNISTTNSGSLTNPSAISFSTVANLVSGYPDMTNSSWQCSACASFVNGLSPDPFGGAVASKTTEDTTTNFHITFVTLTFSLVPTQNYTAAVFVKPGTGTRNVALSMIETDAFANQVTAIFNPSTCAFVSNISAGTGTLASTSTLALSNGWCLIEEVGAVGTSSVSGYKVQISSVNGTTINYTGDGTSSLLYYGPSVE